MNKGRTIGHTASVAERRNFGVYSHLGGRTGRLLPAAAIWVLTAFLVMPPDFDYTGNIQTTFSVTSGHFSGPLILSGALIIAGSLIAARRALTMDLLRRISPGLLALIALATVSVLWSGDTAATERRLFRLYSLVTICFAFAIAGWHVRRLQNVLRPAVTAILIGSIIFGLVAPDLAVEHGAATELVGAWKGLTMQKNTLGALAAVGVLLWVHAWLSRETKIQHIVVGLAASLTCLFLSRSSTSLLSILAAVPFLVLLLRTHPSLRRYMPYIVGGFAILILAYSLAILNLVPGVSVLLAPIMAITGKDMTFSGRSEIWTIVADSISRHPFFGIGYGAYWTGPVVTSPSYDFVLRLDFYPTEAHNGYLEVINELGFVGGACLLAYLISFLRQSLVVFYRDRSQGALYLGLLFLGFMENLSESHWFNISSVEFLFVTLASTCMARQLLCTESSRARQGLHS